MDAEELSAESSLSLDNENMYNAEAAVQPVATEIPENNEEASTKSPSRLIITKMVLENFKSYAGIKEIGPFHKCFSAVVGPNGSGKSNVIDAMLFVFGKRAKKLRLNKVSELIHSSDAFMDSPLEYARVSVHFVEIVDTGDGDDDYEVILGTEIVVTRIAKRDNSSNYKLDGRNCAFKDVATYLESKGIDLNNNRFLILQGEVELISMMAPKGKTEDDEGMLEYLEDIIGSDKYVEQANEAAARVEALTEQRQERLNRVKALEKEKESLEGAKLEAEALLGKEREIRRKKNILIQGHSMEASNDSEEANQKCNELKESLKDTRAKIAQKEKQFSNNDTAMAKETEKHDRILEALKNSKEEFSYFERKDIQLREERKHSKATLKKLEAKIKAEDAKNKDLTAKAKEANENIPGLETKLLEVVEQQSKEGEKLEKMFDEKREVTKELRQKLEKKTQELAPLQQERALFQTVLDTAVTEAKLFEDSSVRSKEQLISAEKELSSLDEKQSMLRLELTRCEEELSESKKRIAEAQKEDEALISQEKALATRSAEMMAEAEEAKTAFQAGSASSGAVTGILAQSKKGGALANAGILGRLGDLGSIPSEYDIAVSTACGMLDHIVVETTQGAQQCLEFLRKNRLGRANFIPLEKMKKGAHDRAVETPDNAPRLFDLIRMRNYNVASAMYLAVGNTLVAPDLETATRWAYECGKRWRVVTIDGKLIETSGTMAGGGKSVKRGGMRVLNSNQASSNSALVEGDVSEDDCKKLEILAKQALDDLQNCRAKRRALQEEIRTLDKNIKTLIIKTPKLSMQAAGCDTTREELTKRIPELRKQSIMSNADLVKLEALLQKVEKCKRDIVSFSTQTSKLEAEVAKLQKSILEAGGPRLKKQQDECDRLAAYMEAMNNKVNAEKVTASSAQKNAEKAEKLKISNQTELQILLEKYKALENDIKVLEDQALVALNAFDDAKEEEEIQRKIVEDATTEFNLERKSFSKLLEIELELVGQIDTLEKQLKEAEKRLKHWQNELQKLYAAEEQDDVCDISDDETDVELGQQMCDEELESQAASSRRKTFPTYSKEALQQYRKDDLKEAISILEQERDMLAKNSNMGAIAEYRKKEQDYLARVVELDEITDMRNSARKVHEDLRRQRLEAFMDGFCKITLKLKEMYQMITLGGDAELELVDSLDPFSEGIVFSVRPPKKSWKNIANLSGGEKTLSSLALVFALHHYRPTPLYVMDEIDAALDFKNVSIVANYIKERTKNAQFIIISLRNNMFELADRLVGIYKTHNCTKSVSIDPRRFGMLKSSGSVTTPGLGEITLQ